MPAGTTASAKRAAAAAAAAAASGPATKKARKPRTLPPPEYDDIWADVYLSGTEWEQLAGVGRHAWDFAHLDDALYDGVLSASAAPGTLVHLFGCTEPQLVPLAPGDAGSLVVVPVIVAVLSVRPPPATVGIKSVQRAEEEIAGMGSLRMGWHARQADNAPRRKAPRERVFVLKCNERRARLKNMDEAAVHKYDYVLPWVLRPDKPLEDPVTSVQVLVDDLEGRENRAPVMLDFDYAVESVDEAVEEAVEDNELDKVKHAAKVKDAITKSAKAKKAEVAAEKAAHQKLVDAISSEDRESLKGMKVFKFYPSNEDDDFKYPDVTGIKAKYVNRYYGQADEVF